VTQLDASTLTFGLTMNCSI